MKVWITKYALTSGIRTAEIEINKDYPSLIMIQEPGRFPEVFHKPHWHTDEVSACQQVRKMIASKIASLKKSLKKMEKLQEEYC